MLDPCGILIMLNFRSVWMMTETAHFKKLIACEREDLLVLIDTCKSVSIYSIFLNKVRTIKW